MFTNIFKSKNMGKKNEKGFTLIELLVVIAIIGLLASVIIASLSTARSKARDSTRISDLNQIQTGLELYYSNCGRYPKNLDATNDITSDCSVIITKFLDEGIFTDPNGFTYYYLPSGTGATEGQLSYCLGTDLEDEDHSKANVPASGTCASGQDMTGTATPDVDYYVTP